MLRLMVDEGLDEIAMGLVISDRVEPLAALLGEAAGETRVIRRERG